jgi:glycosyltransferase 2 family protein
MLAGTRLSLALCGALGIAATAALTVYAGLGTVYRVIGDVGWLGIGWVSVLQLVSIALCSAAWKAVAGNTSFLTCLTARFIRVGVSNLAGIVPAVGEVAGARALSLLGASAGVAAASTVVDVALEALSQAIYTMLGLIPLLLLIEHVQATRWLLAITIAIVPTFAVFIVTRRRSALMMAERIIARAARALGFSAGPDLKLTRNVLDIYQRHRHVWLALLLHLAAWLMSAVQLWAAARALDRSLLFGEALAMQSLAYAARGALFFVPAGFGVQEGTFVLIGAVLGVDSASALALSLILRTRDILLGLPAIVVWFTAESRRRWRTIRVAARGR